MSSRANILITTGPTREYIDPVRFITNASSGRMGAALARRANALGHAVTLLAGACDVDVPADVAVKRFVSVADLKALLAAHFDKVDLLLMAAAVGDFTVADPARGKISRHDGPITLSLTPTEDLLGGLAGRKRPGQLVVAFAVETGPREIIEAKVRDEMARKGADFCVVNTPAAMNADRSEAAMLGPGGEVLTWAMRTKDDLAEMILGELERTA